MQTGVTRRGVKVDEPRRKRARRNKAEGSLPIVSVDGPLAKVVVVNASAPTNRSFARAAKETAQQTVLVSGRVRHGNARGNIFVIPSPITRLTICRAREIHGEYRIEGVALNHVLHSLIKKIVQAD